MSFNTSRGDTSPRDTAEGMPFGLATTVCDTGMGLETLGGLERDPWSRRSEPARQYNSTVTPHKGAQWEGGGNVWKSIGSSLMNSQAIEYYQAIRSHKARPKNIPSRPRKDRK